MKPARFEYEVAENAEHAVELLAQFGEGARPLAGGQSLIALMNMRLAQPEALVDLNCAGDLATIATIDGEVQIGAMVRQSAAEHSEEIFRQLPLLAKALPHIGHHAIRHRGTIGGSAAHADPAAEIPAVLCALDATFVLHSASGGRAVPAAEFFVGHYETAVQPGELLTTISVPVASPGTGASYEAFSRRDGDFAVVGVATQLSVATDRTLRGVRIVVSGVSSVPLRMSAAEAALDGQPFDLQMIEEVAGAAARDLDPGDDVHGSAAYRKHLAKVLIRRAVTDAHAQAVA